MTPADDLPNAEPDSIAPQHSTSAAPELTGSSGSAPLPPLPKSSRGHNTAYWGWSADDMRAYTLAACAERDAEIERLRKLIEELEEQVANWVPTGDGNWTNEQWLRNQLLMANECADVVQTERDTLRTRVAELEEKLLVMCVGQINEPEVAMNEVAWMIEANDPALYEKRARWFTGVVHTPWTTDPSKGLRFPTKDIGLDIFSCIIQGEHSDGKIFTLNCEFKYISVTEHVWCDEPSPDPAPLAAQGVEGEPHHER